METRCMNTSSYDLTCGWWGTTTLLSVFQWRSVWLFTASKKLPFGFRLGGPSCYHHDFRWQSKVVTCLLLFNSKIYFSRSKVGHNDLSVWEQVRPSQLMVANILIFPPSIWEADENFRLFRSDFFSRSVSDPEYLKLCSYWNRRKQSIAFKPSEIRHDCRRG